MKRVVALIMTLITLTMVGCSEKTIILEENAKEKQSLDNGKITERVIENKYGKSRFEPLFYNEEGVYGVLSDTRLNVDISPEEMNKPYLIDGNGEFNELDKDYFSSDELKLIQETGKYYGIYSEGTHTSDRTYYYMDIVNNVKVKLDGYEEFIYEARNNGGYSNIGFKIDKHYDVNTKYTYVLDKETSKPISKEKITIIDLENNIAYSCESLGQKHIYFYYDYRENSIMSIDTKGSVERVNLNDGKITFGEYKKIELNGLDITEDITLDYCNMYGENLILSGTTNNDYYAVYAIYNIYSNEVIIIGDFIKTRVKNSNLFISSYNDGLYLSRIGVNQSIEQIYKVSDEIEIDEIKAISNEDGSGIFLSKIKYAKGENESNYVEKIEYSFIDLEK